MFHLSPYTCNVSLKLSEVLGEIGVTERMILKKRRAILLEEIMRTTSKRLRGLHQSNYLLGSQPEGTTTRGLESDKDVIICLHKNNVMQDWSEWIPGTLNLLMLQDETSPPGYCRLQLLRDDAPLPVPFEVGNGNVSDVHGRILHKNTLQGISLPEGEQRQGPSFVKPGQIGITPMDRVPAYCCKSWPHVTRKWFDYQGSEGWPTANMKTFARKCKCLVVPVGSKVSENAEFEWRISTSLAERYLMFNLNMTQITCFILMKMILKTYINPHFEGCISSYICKTVLLHCIKGKDDRIWQKHNLLRCLSNCLLTLYQCISNRNCPHFIIHENNLIAGKISSQDKPRLLDLMSNFIQGIDTALYGIKIDNLGLRLKVKLNMIPQVPHNLPSSDDFSLIGAATSLKIIANSLADIFKVNRHHIFCSRLEIGVQNFFKIVSNLTSVYREGSTYEKAACKLQAPLYCTLLGSMIESRNVSHSNTVHPQAFAWILAGLNSDVASSRLKLATLFYYTGDIDRTESTLQGIEENYDLDNVEPVCSCYNFSATAIKEGFCQIANNCDEEAITEVVAFCVTFSPHEMRCVPRELQYEMFRSTREEQLHRGKHDYWMDWAVVDSLPYLYFLQYKVYSCLQQREGQQLALNNLKTAIETERNLGHRETALNLLGQCLEQADKHNEALHCYIKSLNLRARNNAARIHICRLLANAVCNAQ